MVFNCIAKVMAIGFLILSVIAAATEGAYIRSAGVRNLFRRLRITLRELSPLGSAAIAAVYVIISLKLKNADMWLTVNVLAVFAAGSAILNFYRIHGFASPKRRRKKKRGLLSVSEVEEVQEVGCVRNVGELEELTRLDAGESAE